MIEIRPLRECRWRHKVLPVPGSQDNSPVAANPDARIAASLTMGGHPARVCRTSGSGPKRSLCRRGCNIPLHLCVKEYATNFVFLFSSFSSITRFFTSFFLLRRLWTYNDDTPTRRVVRHPSTTLDNFRGQHFLRHRHVIPHDYGRNYRTIRRTSFRSVSV